MISIIICSRNNTIQEDFLLNIERTIECEYELIVINNSENKYSIFEAYNNGLERSRGEIICFVHEDVKFHSSGWGKKIIQKFKMDDKIGLIGIAGGQFKTQMPSNWWQCPVDGQAVNIIQHQKNKAIRKWTKGFHINEDKEVVTIDGVFMAQRKDERIRFNEQMEGFHHYDMNLCFENFLNGNKIMVTNDVLIEHLSPGDVSKAWVESALKFHSLYHSKLPISSGKLMSKPEIADWEFKNGKNFIQLLLKYGFKKEAIIFWKKTFINKPYSLFHLRFVKRFLEK